jgi:iron complex outermembrane receptor protein
VNLLHREFDDGTDRFQQIGGLALNWKPSASVEITPFWSASDLRDSESQVSYIPAGEALPPPVPMHHRFTPDWADYSGYAQLYGILASAAWKEGWSTDVGLFRASNLTTEEVFVQFEAMQPDGSARLKAYANPRHESASTSGEVRIRKTLTDGEYLSTILLSLRGRSARRTFGGAATLDLGNVDLGSSFDIAEPRRNYGPLTISSVRQTWLGVAYRGVWSNRGEFNASLSTTDYRKNVRAPGLPEVVSQAAPLLVNVSGSINLHKRLALYTSYATGLEENGVAPASAVNRNELLPALETSQVEFGTRWLVGRSVKAIVGVFELRKPYFSADGAGVYRQLGDVQNRGLEVSISGPLSDQLNLVLGGNLMDPRVQADTASAGRLGKRPVGIPSMVANGSLEWRTPFVEGLSFDAGLDFRGHSAAKTNNSFFLPPRSLVNLGARYRLKTKGADASLRLLMSNVFDKNGFDLAGPGAFYPFGGRVLSASLVTDF